MTGKGKIQGRLRLLGPACALAAAGLGALVAWAWLAGVGDLLAFPATNLPVAPNTAVCLMFAGGAFFLHQRRTTHARAARIAPLMMIPVAVTAVLACLRPWIGWDAPLQAWIMEAPVLSGSVAPDQMSPLIGALFLALLTAWFLQLISRGRKSSGGRAAGLIALVVLLAATVVGANDLLGQAWFHSNQVTGVALPTSIGFMLLGWVLLADGGDYPPFSPGPSPRPGGPVPEGRSLPTLIAALVALVIGTLAAGHVRHEQRQEREEARQLLAAVGKLKMAQITDWRDECVNDARNFTDAEFFSGDLRTYLDHPQSAGARARLRQWLGLLKDRKRYSVAALFDTNAVLRVTLPEQTNSNVVLPSALMGDAFGSNEVLVSDSNLGINDHLAHLEILLPVFDRERPAGALSSSNSVPLAVILLRLDPHEFLFPWLQSWPTPSRTAETVLFRRAGDEILFLNYLRHPTNTALTLRFSIAANPDLPAVQAVLGRTGLAEGRDYRGVPVLADVHPVPGSDWFLQVKMDRDEIYANLRRQAWMTLLVGALLVAVTRLFVGSLYRRRETAGALRELAAERQRLALAQRVEHLMKNASDAILLTDEADNILEANDRAQELHGYSLAELQTMNLSVLRAPGAGVALPRPGGGPAAFESRHQRRDGSVFPVDISSKTVEIGGTNYQLDIIRDITERKRAETALQEREEQLRLYAEHSPVAVAMFDRQMNYLVASRHWMQQYKLGTQIIVGRTHYEIFPGLPPRWIEVHRRCLAGAVEKCEEDAYPQKDGTVLWIRWEVRPWYQADGAIGGLIIFSEDITERKKSGEALKLFRALIDRSSDGIYVVDPVSAFFLDMNESACRALGYTREEMLALTVFDVTSEVDRALYAATNARMKTAGGVTLEVSHRRKDGSTYPAEVSLSLVRLDREYLVGIVRDITERQRVEHELRWKTAFLEAQSESALDGILVVNERQKRILINQRMLQLFKVPEHVTRDDDDSSLLRYVTSQTKDPAAFIKRVAYLYEHPDAIGRDEIELTNGTILDRYSSPVRDKSGHYYGRIWAFRDITEHRYLEVELRQAQKMEAIGQLAGGVAHDFNNILAATLMNLGSLQERNDLAPDVREGLDELEALAQRAAALTRQLLVFSRRSRVQMRPLDLNAAVENILAMLRRLIGEQIQLDWHPHAPLPGMNADVGMLEQLVVNLVVNARDAMPGGGRITLSTGVVELTEQTVRGHPEGRPGRFICLTANDTGCGMSEAVLNRIFEPFFTTKETGKGTGLGLATVYGIVKQHQGWITVASQPGAGSTFRVFLPVHEAPASAPPKVAAASPVPGGRETILFVEDDPTLRKAVCALLRHLGYRILDAPSGVAALKIWAEQGDQVQLLYTDMVMPEGMNGLELARALRATRPELPVIIASGYSSELLQKDSLPAENIHFQPKPASSADIASLLRRCLTKPPA